MTPTRIAAPGRDRSRAGLVPPDVEWVQQAPAHLLFEALPTQRRRATADLIELILRSRRSAQGPRTLIEDIVQRLNDLGMPIDRYGSSTEVLTPDHDATARLWTRDHGFVEDVYLQPAGHDAEYAKSPFFESAQTHRWVEVWLPDTSDDRFGIVPDLRAAGYTHYLCLPFLLGSDENGWITMATKSVQGFSREDLCVVALLEPALERMIDGRVGWATLDRLLRTYVGDEPHRAILAGNVKRGQVSTIRSAILFADMRDSTGQTAELSAVQAVELFNDFFDNLVPPIENGGGEVLKYIGDGLLAIFRGEEQDAVKAVNDALVAAEAIIANLQRFNAARSDRRPIEAGLALHFGEAAYGNVGSGLRLDFTVIGRDISLASRIGGMNARLGEPILMSEAFVRKLGRPVQSLGAFAARGFATPIVVYRPDHHGNAQP